MNIRIQSDLLFGTASLFYSGKQLVYDNVLIDTGSPSTVFLIDKVIDIGIQPELDDAVHVLTNLRRFKINNHRGDIFSLPLDFLS